MELTYHWEGDVLIPDLELEDGRNYQIGKCGRMRQRYLFENHHAMYTHLVLTEKLWKHLEEVDMECNDMMDMLTVRMAERVVGMNTENTEINEGTKRYANRISYIEQSYLLCMPSCFITKGKRFC